VNEQFKNSIQHRLHYLALISLLIRRELKVKYRGSTLGYLWSMLNPLLFMVTISIVFSFVMRGIENYNLFVLSGILFWNMVTLSLNLGSTAIVRNASLLQKVRIPIWVFPVVPPGLGVTNFMLSLLPYFIVFAFTGRAWPEQLWLFPVILALTLIFLTCLSVILSTMNVFFRDVSHVMEPLLTLLFYGTPIIYDRHGANFPAKAQNLLTLNPFTHFVEAYRATLFGGSTVTLSELGVICLLTAISVGLAVWVYKSNKNKIIYNL
jgi:ABC-type polysaccharide/polyol phosphate export permease